MRVIKYYDQKVRVRISEIFSFQIYNTVANISVKFHIINVVSASVALGFVRHKKHFFPNFPKGPNFETYYYGRDETWIYEHDPKTTDLSSEYRAKVDLRSRKFAPNLL